MQLLAELIASLPACRISPKSIQQHAELIASLSYMPDFAEV